MNMQAGVMTGGAAGAGTKRAEALLRRYPEIGEAETAELVAFFRTAPLLDLGGLTGREDIKAQIAAFRRDHAAKLGLTARDWTIVAGWLAAVLMLGFLLWDSGLG